jgi:hypothetical protein
MRHTLLPAYRQRGIALYTVAFTDQADQALLQEMAQATAGEFRFIPRATMLHTAFQHLFVRAHQAEALPLTQGRLLVDPSIQEAALIISKRTPQEPIALLTPQGTSVHARSQRADLTWSATPSYDLVHLRNPEPGTWRVQGRTDGEDSVAIIGASTVTLQVELSPPYQEAGVPITLTAFLQEQGHSGPQPEQVEGLRFHVAIMPPQGDRLTVPLAPQGHGRFAAQLPTLEAVGPYELVVTATAPTVHRQRTLSVTLRPPCFTPTVTTAETVTVEVQLTTACPRFADLRLEAGRGPDSQRATWTPLVALRPEAYRATLPLPPPGHPEQVTLRIRGRLQSGEPVLLLKGPWPLPVTSAPRVPPVPRTAPGATPSLLLGIAGVAWIGSGVLGGLLWRARRVQRRLRAEVCQLQQAHQPCAAAPAPLPTCMAQAEERRRALNTSAQCASDNLRFLQDALDDLKALLEAYGHLLRAAKDGTVTATEIDSVEAALAQADAAYLLAEGPQAIQQALEGIEHMAATVRQ